jgi:DNA polymerase-3 subunit delta'
LLKTLEEPRENTLIIILAHNRSKLPITILSRCQSVHIAPDYSPSTCDWLRSKITENISDDKIKQYLIMQNGAPFKVLQALSLGEFAQMEEYQLQLLALVNQAQPIKEINALKEQPLLVLKSLQQLVIEAIRLKTLNKKAQSTTLDQLVQRVKLDFLFQMLDDITQAFNLQHIDTQLLLDNILVVWSHITHLKHYPTIINRSYL